MSEFVDPLGFTRQTELLLRGLGARNLTEEFKKRNISSETLHKLTKEDFMKLGANEDQAENIVKTLSISEENNKSIKSEPCNYRISDKVNILKTGEKQLGLIKTFLTYCRLRLREERINAFVDVDKALSSSQILCIAADAVLKEINEAELKLKELQAVTPRSNKKCSYMLYCIPVGGLCIATCMLLIRFWN